MAKKLGRPKYYRNGTQAVNYTLASDAAAHVILHAKKHGITQSRAASELIMKALNKKLHLHPQADGGN